MIRATNYNNTTNGNKQENNSTTNKIDADIEANRSGLLRFNIPEHIPVLISEVAGRIIHRFELRELSEDSETLNNSIPSWVVDAISGVLFYIFIYFFLGIQIIFIYFQENQATIRSLYICFASL